MNASAAPATSISPVEGRVHIIFDEAEIASSLKALRMERANGEAVIFIPFEDVHPGILEASDTTRDHAGPGVAHFYTLKTLTADGPDNAWYYPYADGDYEPIRDLVTFAGPLVEMRISQV